MIYNPADWYWLADDGRLFASAVQSLVEASDDSYKAWQAAGNTARRWPSTADGAQTSATLQSVFDAAEVPVYVDLLAYAAAKRYAVETGGLTVDGVKVATDDRSKTLLIGTRIAAEANPAFTTPWVGVDGVTTTLSAAQIIALSDAVLAHVQACFITFSQVVAGVAARSIISTADVDAGGWPTSKASS